MMAHPDVLKKAQAELEEVCGPSVPGAKHIDKLLYLRAIMTEVSLRRLKPSTAPNANQIDSFFDGDQALQVACLTS